MPLTRVALASARRQSEDREATKRLLKACSRRAVDRLQSELDAATESPERAHRLISEASPVDLAVLRNLYLRATGVTLAVTGTAFFAALPRRSRPVASAFAAVGTGGPMGPQRTQKASMGSAPSTRGGRIHLNT